MVDALDVDTLIRATTDEKDLSALFDRALLVPLQDALLRPTTP